MKKVLGFLFAFVVAFSAVVPAYAEQQNAQAEKIVVTLSTIESIMKTYNLDVQKAVNDLQTSREDYKYSAQEKSDKNQYTVAQYSFDETVQQKIADAKQKYLAFCADNTQLSADQTAYDIAQKQLTADSQMLQQGYLTQKDYSASLDNTQKANSTLQTQNAKVTQEKGALRTLLNIPETSDMDIRPVSDSDTDFSGISKIDYGQDVIAMRNSNVEILKASLNYSTAKTTGYSSEQDIDNAKIALDQTGSAQEAAFKQLYDTLINSYQSYQEEVLSVQRKSDEVESEKQAMTLGYVSQKKYDGDALELQNQQSKLDSDRLTLYVSYMNYSNMKNGYSAAGSAVS